MSQESESRESERDVEPGGPGHRAPDGEGAESLPAPTIILGNVGSIDDVPPDLIEEEVSTDDDEGT
jgi:hypothetical protein